MNQVHDALIQKGPPEQEEIDSEKEKITFAIQALAEEVRVSRVVSSVLLALSLFSLAVLIVLLYSHDYARSLILAITTIPFAFMLTRNTEETKGIRKILNISTRSVAALVFVAISLHLLSETVFSGAIALVALAPGFFLARYREETISFREMTQAIDRSTESLSQYETSKKDLSKHPNMPRSVTAQAYIKQLKSQGRAPCQFEEEALLYVLNRGHQESA